MVFTKYKIWLHGVHTFKKMIIRHWPLFLFSNSLIIPLTSIYVAPTFSLGLARMESPCFVMLTWSRKPGMFGDEIRNPGAVSLHSFRTVTTLLLFIDQTNIQEWIQPCIQFALFKINQNSKYLQIYCPSMTASWWQCSYHYHKPHEYIILLFRIIIFFLRAFFPHSLHIFPPSFILSHSSYWVLNVCNVLCKVLEMQKQIQ